MAIKESLRPISSIEVIKLRPSEVNEEFVDRYGLKELIGKAYEMNDGDAGDRTRGEYAEDDKRSDVYLAIRNQKAIGSLVISKWTPDDIWGKNFWEYLRDRYPIAYRKLHKSSSLGINVIGIATHPTIRRQGVTEELWKNLFSDYNPSFVTGWTKNPNAVMSRAKILSKFGYRSFYGNAEVTPDRPQAYSRIHLPVLMSDIKFRTRMMERCNDNDAQVYSIETTLPNSFPNMALYPDYIQGAFEGVIKTQKELDSANKNETAISFLIGIKEEVLPD